MFRKVGLTYMLFAVTAVSMAIDVSKFTFSHIGVQEGMKSQRVYSLATTTEGAIWWTTKQGVERGNGSAISSYTLGDVDLYSNFAGRVVKFASYASADMQDSLFVFDNKGKVFCYNKTQNRFDMRFNMAKSSGYNGVVEDVMVTADGMLFATNSGLFWVGNGSNKAQCISQDFYANSIIPMKDSSGNVLKGNILVGTNKGLMRMNYELRNTKFELRKTRTVNSELTCILPCNSYTAYYDHEKNLLWVGTFDEGVKVQRWGSKEWIDVQSIPSNPIRSIIPYDNKTMLIGVDGYGVYQVGNLGAKAERYSEIHALFASVLFNANDERSGVLHGNGIYGILVDSWGNIVMGSYSGGIDVARPVGSTTAMFKHVRNNPQTIANEHVNCVQEDGGRLLIGTDDGVSIIDSSTGACRNVAQNMVVLSLCKTPSGGILIGTYGSGVCELAADGSVRQIYSKANGSLKDDHVYDMLYDRHGNLWIGCLDGNLAVKSDKGFIYYDINYVQSLTELSDGRIAVGSSHGLYAVTLGKKGYEELHYMENGGEAVNKFILDLFEDNTKNLWIGTDGGGVYIYNIKNKSCSQITTDEGLPSNVICSITKDKTGRIWFGTENGLAFVYPDNPTKVVDVNYCHGLLAEYTRNAAANLSNGQVLYGTVEGAIIIDPQHIQAINYTAPLRLLRVALINDNDAVDRNGTLCSKYSIEEMERFNEEAEKMLQEGTLTLNYSQRSFELYYESINLRNKFDIAYQYKIGDGAWSTPSIEQSIRFVNLEPGKHILYIRCVSKTGGALLDEQKLELIIMQPWWNSWWMWCFYIALIIFAFYGAWKIYDLHSKYNRLIVDRVDSVERQGESRVEKMEEVVEEDDKAESVEDVEKADEVNVSLDETTVQFVNKATKIVLENLTDTSFTIDSLCREIGMSRTLFYVKIKSYTGHSPQDFVRMIRLEKASSLLRQGHSVSEVADLTGFDNPKYFSIVFKKYFGVSPSKYKA